MSLVLYWLRHPDKDTEASMQIQHLEHRHGGRITELTAVAHDTFERRASWHFIGSVQWADGSKSDGTEISPVCMCRDPDDKAACDELDAAMEKLNDYLHRNGEWNDMQWKPKAKRGQESIA